MLLILFLSAAELFQEEANECPETRGQYINAP